MGENNDFEKDLNEIGENVDTNDESAETAEEKQEKDVFEDTEETVAVTEALDEVPYKSKSREMFEWIGSIAIALVIALVLRNFVVTFVKVEGSSMVPTLIDSERLIVIRLGYEPKAGDIIILNPPAGRGPYVKRIIGMPGQTVTVDNITGNVYVDGELLSEPYINNKTTSPQQSEFVVPDKCVFVMGDNRGCSHDSRASDVSFIPYENVLGKVVFRVWPFTKFGTVK